MICYDTINWYVRRENVSESNIHRFITIMPDFVSAKDTKTKLLTGYGNYSNLKITVSRSKIKVKGSIPVFIHKSNLKNVFLSEVASFFDFFADILSVHLRDIIVTRIDIAANIEMEHSPQCYFGYLGESTYMERILWGTNLMYSQKGRKDYALYDKGAEIETNKGKKIIGNILRPELRLKRGVAVQMHKDVVTAADLCNKRFFDKLIEKWLYEYDKIDKIKPVVDFVDILKTSTRKTTLDCLLGQLLGERCKQNPLFVSEFVASIKRMGLYSNSDYYNLLKKDFERLLDYSTIRKRSDLEKELTYKIYSVARAA